MKDGLRSSTLSKREKDNVYAGASCDDSYQVSADEAPCKLGKGRRGRKRKNEERENKSNDANSVDFKENIGLSMINKDLVSANDLVISSTGSEVEVGSGAVHEDCSKIANIAVQVGPNASDSQKEKLGFHLISNDMDPANNSVLSSPEREVEEGSGTERLECNKDAVVDVEVAVNTEIHAKPDAHADKDKERENVESPKRVDDRNSSDDKEKIGSPSISNNSDHANAFVYSSSEKRVEEASGTEYVECSREANGDVEVGVNGHCDANIGDAHDEDTCKRGKSQLGIEREKAESPKIGSDVTRDGIEEDRGSPLSSHGLDSVKESVVSTLEREFERSESKNVECSKDADSGEECANADDANAIGDADKSTLKLGKSRRGRKRKKVESSESGDHETKRKKVKDGKGQVVGRVLRSRTMTMSGGEKVVDGTTNADVVEKEMKETDQSDKKSVHTEMDESFRPIGMQRKKIKRTRGRPPKVQGKNGPSEVILKEKCESCQPIDTRRKKIKRPRGRPPKMQGKNGVAEVICMEKGESSQPIGTQREKIKRPRGRPPKVHGKNGASEVICEETLKATGSKESSDLPKAEGIIKGSQYSKVRKKTGASEVISAEKQKVRGSDKNIEQSNAGEDTVKHSNSPEVGRHSRLTSHSQQARSKSGKKLKMRKFNQEGEVRRGEEKQLVREQIIGMLKQAGWTIQYRPRQNREYNDAVYVDCEGRAYWSVTLAYRKLKEKVEGGGADSKTISAFTSIPEEMFSKLFRVTKVKKKKNKKAKQHGQAGKESSKNKPTANSRGGSKHKGKPKSFSRVGDKSSNTKMEGGTLRCAKDNSARSSHKGMTRLNREKRQSRKPCALLARRSEKGLDPDIDGFMSYNGKHSLLSWMIDLGTVPPDGKVHYMNHKMASVMLEGRITRDGIQCGCCDKILSISDFESHAGTKLCQPFYNIYLESGVSLLQCLVDSWSKQEVSDCNGFHFVNVDGEDPNDDTCNICGDGGDLICCDSCPSTFHQNCLNIERFPSGDWQCVYCLCKFCGTASGSTSQRDDCNKMNVYELLTCCLCEGKFHQLCVHGNDAVNVASSCPSFCGRKCQELYEQLQVLLGVKQELEEGFSWTLIQRSDVSQDISLGGAPLKVESNSKLAVAFSIMDECFLPIVDQRSGINMIHNVVYSCGSNFSRLNYSGFFTAILERGDEIISAASIRIHGNQLAEMPFIGTRNIFRRQGMCRRLLNAIESALCFLDVEKLIIPAISELLQTWTSVFGFKPLEESKRQEMKCLSMVVFPGTDLLQKPLLKSQFAHGNMAPAADVKFTALRTNHHSMHSLPISSSMGLSVGSESTNSPEVFVQHARGISAEAAAFEPGLNLPGGSLKVASNMASETDNLLESAAKDHCPVRLSLTSDNKLVLGSESSACDAPESDGHPTAEWMDTNAQSGSITVLLDEKSMKCNTENNVDSKSSAVSQIGSDTKHCEGKTVQAMEEGKEAVDCEQKAEVENFKHDCNPFGEGVIHHSAETLVHPQGTDLVDGFQVSDKNLKCEVLNATSPMSSDANHEMQLHHNSHGVMVHATSPSKQQGQDIATDTPFSDDGNPYSSCQRDVLESCYPEVAASVDT